MPAYRKALSPIQKVCYCAVFYLSIYACAPRVINMGPVEGTPGTSVSLSMEYLVGWPRVEIGGKMMDWPQIKLLAANPARKEVPGEELALTEIQDTPVYDSRSSPGKLYSHYPRRQRTTRRHGLFGAGNHSLRHFSTVWPFVFRSNQTQFDLRVLPVQ